MGGFLKARMPWYLLLLSIALFQCKKADPEMEVAPERIPAPFLETKLTAGETTFEFALSFPACAYESGFGPEGCSRIICRAVYNGKRSEGLEQRICMKFEQHEIPRLVRAQSEAERRQILYSAASTFGEAHTLFAADRKVTSEQDIHAYPERLPEFVTGQYL